MILEILKEDYAVCKLNNISALLPCGIFFLARSDNEISLVCESQFVPNDVLFCEKSWRGLRIKGSLPFETIGVIAHLTKILKEANVSVFAISTYDTDYFFVKHNDFDKAKEAFIDEGYEIVHLL